MYCTIPYGTIPERTYHALSLSGAPEILPFFNRRKGIKLTHSIERFLICTVYRLDYPTTKSSDGRIQNAVQLVQK